MEERGLISRTSTLLFEAQIPSLKALRQLRELTTFSGNALEHVDCAIYNLEKQSVDNVVYVVVDDDDQGNDDVVSVVYDDDDDDNQGNDEVVNVAYDDDDDGDDGGNEEGTKRFGDNDEV